MHLNKIMHLHSLLPGFPASCLCSASLENVAVCIEARGVRGSPRVLRLKIGVRVTQDKKIWLVGWLANKVLNGLLVDSVEIVDG
jgi:hypothetical protein